MEQVLKQLDQLVDVLVGKFFVVPFVDMMKANQRASAIASLDATSKYLGTTIAPKIADAAAHSLTHTPTAEDETSFDMSLDF